MSDVTILTRIQLAGTKKGIISISDVTEPYGAGSTDVVSIGIALNGDDVQWKAHVPYDNLDEVIKALQEAKAKK